MSGVNLIDFTVQSPIPVSGVGGTKRIGGFNFSKQVTKKENGFKNLEDASKPTPVKVEWIKWFGLTVLFIIIASLFYDALKKKR